MIIGIDGHMIGDHSGGNESYYTNILLNMDTSNDEVILFVKKGIDTSLFSERFKIVEFEEKSAFKRNFIEIPRLCKKYNLDVIHMQYYVPFICSCPIVCTIHDICFEHYKDIFTKKEYIRQKLLIPYAARKSRAIFTVSNNAKEDIVKQYKVDESKIHVTYNAVGSSFRKLTKIELGETELRKKFGIGDSQYVLTVGNLQPRKNLPRLIRAFVSMQRENSNDTKLVIVGKKAWLANDIIKEACANSDKIILTDYVTNDELVRLYNAAACFVYPSFFEGFGIPPIEAMACGTPVAVADRTSLPEVVGDAGLYFNPFDEEQIKKQLITLLDDKQKRQELIEKGYSRIRRFDWKESARIIMNVYHKIDK